MKSTGSPTSGELALQQLQAPPVLHGKVSFGSLDDQILAHVVTKPPLAWFVAFAITSTALLIGLGCETMPTVEMGEKLAGMGLAVVRLTIQEEGGTRATYARALGIARELLQDLQRARREPIPLSELIGSLVAGFERRHPECTFALSFGEVARGYGEEADITVFRCVQESLTNVIKHAKATRASVYIGERSATSTLRVRIEDNGVGIPAGANSGIGFTAMRERIRSLDGTSSIDSSPNGTTISIDLPLRAKVAGKPPDQLADPSRPSQSDDRKPA
jgi:hypothetical protein